MLKLPINHMHCYSTLSRLCKLHFCCFLYNLKPSHLRINLATLLFTHLRADIISVQQFPTDSCRVMKTFQESRVRQEKWKTLVIGANLLSLVSVKRILCADINGDAQVSPDMLSRKPWQVFDFFSKQNGQT